MYDISGSPEESFADKIKSDWTWLNDVYQVASHTQYIQQDGKPVVKL